MNLDMLTPLENRWPNDTVTSPPAPSVNSLTELLSTDRVQNIYSDRLSLDPHDSQTIASFAENNGMSYTGRSDLVTEGLTDTARAWPGHTLNTTAPMLAHVVKGTVYGYDIRMYLAYTPSSSQTRGYEDVRLVKRSIIRVNLPKLFPQIVLESNKNDKTAISTMPSTFEVNQKLSLEGNFSDYFDFYTPRELQINTLTVLAPNFMQLLMESALSFDVEFFGNEMVLVTKDPLYSLLVMDNAMRALESQLKYLDRLQLSWNYKPLTPPFDTLKKPYLKGETVKIGSLRISPLQMISLILLGFIAFAILLLLL